jgi:hypothetical protein
MGLAVAGLTERASAQSAAAPTQITVQADRAGATIEPDIFGQFAEHLGTGIYGGVWVGKDSAIPNVRGIRTAFPMCGGPAAASPTAITGATALGRLRSASIA